MNGIREYGWRDWISVPKNKELYNKDMSEGLRQFKLEQQRKARQSQAAVFKHRGLY